MNSQTHKDMHKTKSDCYRVRALKSTPSSIKWPRRVRSRDSTRAPKAEEQKEMRRGRHSLQKILNKAAAPRTGAPEKPMGLSPVENQALPGNGCTCMWDGHIDIKKKTRGGWTARSNGETRNGTHILPLHERTLASCTQTVAPDLARASTASYGREEASGSVHARFWWSLGWVSGKRLPLQGNAIHVEKVPISCRQPYGSPLRRG